MSSTESSEEPVLVADDAVAASPVDTGEQSSVEEAPSLVDASDGGSHSDESLPVDDGNKSETTGQDLKEGVRSINGKFSM